MDKADFIGKQALQKQIERGPRKLLVSLTIDTDHAPAHGGDPVFASETQIGSITSGGYGHRVQQNIAYAYIDPAHADVGTPLQVGILGECYSAVVADPVRYDSENSRIRQ